MTSKIFVWPTTGSKEKCFQSAYTTLGKFEFGFGFEEMSDREIKNSYEKSYDYRNVIDFEKFRFKNVFCPHENVNPAFSNSRLRLKSVFEKLRFQIFSA